MNEDYRYALALKTALGVITTIDGLPFMPRAEKLAKVTYAILEAICQAEVRLRAASPQPSMPSATADAVKVHCQRVADGETQHQGTHRRNTYPALPPPL